ncbi:MAG: nucleoside monophosphate kinase [Candidatus Nanoarchaeia archaeon]|nr:nucleoside monophosphate kinase [Candidatus Nanoarchaeia archaeon]
MNIIFLGAPGSGKGTVSQIAAREYNLQILSTGEILKNMAHENHPLGLRARDEYWGKGFLVPDEIMLPLLEEEISKTIYQKGLILDGFPRTIPQAEKLEEIIKIDPVINLLCSEELITKRILARMQCKKCNKPYGLNPRPPENRICRCGGEIYQRVDDTEETIKRRLNEYENKTLPLIKFYKERIITVDQDEKTTPESCFDDVKKALDSYLS